MSEFKHTPGPWSVKAGDWDESGDARYTLDGIEEVSLADARLIAAAPDLLDACRQFSRALESEDEYELGNAYQSAGLAIAKATGAEQ